MKNKPLLHDMMSNLYFLFKEGWIKQDKMENILMSEYDIDDFSYSLKTFNCIQYINKDYSEEEEYEIKMSQTIWI